ncbi:DsrE family protein [Herbaspirillum sp. GCM10030257]|uniref:DsrE family protein n=1 Tax=Herbaspirillum sp. GCM10030257 TaxID=3273393 RepID=UPI003606CF87
MKRRTILTSIAVLLPALTLGRGLPAFAAEPVKVVYHLADGIDQASRAMANIRNHLRAEPDTRIVVVANGDGIRFLLAGARERNGKPFDSAITALAAQGVEFKVCGNTLTAHDVSPSQLVPETKLVTAGVVELARLQAKEGYVYIRP